jgi:hypothetical protein
MAVASGVETSTMPRIVMKLYTGIALMFLRTAKATSTTPQTMVGVILPPSPDTLAGGDEQHMIQQRASPCNMGA